MIKGKCPGWSSWAEGEEMSGPTQLPNMSQRSVLQCLSLTDWKNARRLPALVGPMAIDRLNRNGWIEVRREEDNVELRLTALGHEVMRKKLLETK
jgi:hypothetical protein